MMNFGLPETESGLKISKPAEGEADIYVITATNITMDDADSSGKCNLEAYSLD